MGIPGARISKAQIRREKRQSRKESRANFVNAKRNLVLDDAERVKAPEPSQAEKLKLWRLEKKKKMEEEKLKRRPPFRSYINVKHTGLSPYKNTYPASLNPIRKIKKTDSDTNNAASQRKETTSSRQITENNRVPDRNMATRITRQTFIFNKNGVSSKQDPSKTAFNSLLPVRNTRSTKKSPEISTASERVPVIEKKPLRIVQPTNKAVKPTVTTKKTDNKIRTVNTKEVKGVNNINTGANTKKEVVRNNLKKENKENISAVKVIKVKKNVAASDVRTPQYNTRSRSKAASTEPIITKATSAELTSPSSSSKTVEPSNGPAFQRTRILDETTKLETLKTKWLDKEKEDKHLPDNIRDEILSVTGLTSLLISSKFEQFKTLIDDCEKYLKRQGGTQRIVPDDLDGFYEMMYIQVVQLHNKYANLERLMLNNWQEQRSKPNVTNKKKSMIKTGASRKSVTAQRSRFQDFLNKKKEDNKNQEIKSNDSVADLNDLVAAANQENTDEPFNLSSLKSCLVTPKAVKNLITARRSRRSSMKIIMSMSGVGKFDIDGTSLCPSPKVEKRVMFTEID